MELGSFIPYGQHEATISHISLADTFENLLGEPGASRRHPMPLALSPPRLPCPSNPVPTLLQHLTYTGLPAFLNNSLRSPLLTLPSSRASTSICVQDRPRFCLRLTQRHGTAHARARLSSRFLLFFSTLMATVATPVAEAERPRPRDNQCPKLNKSNRE